MKGYLLAAAGAIILFGAAFYYYRTQQITLPSYSPAPQEPPGHGVVGDASLDKDPFDVTITYTDQGFSPANVTITQGERVRFLNASKGPFWPASGVHPTHSLYPEKESTDCLGSSFDACENLAPGEFFDFTFYYIGSWPFHDHLEAFNTGTVTVVSR